MERKSNLLSKSERTARTARSCLHEGLTTSRAGAVFPQETRRLNKAPKPQGKTETLTLQPAEPGDLVVAFEGGPLPSAVLVLLDPEASDAANLSNARRVDREHVRRLAAGGAWTWTLRERRAGDEIAVDAEVPAGVDAASGRGAA